MPKSNADFWKKKFDENMIRDAKNLSDLAAAGWVAMIVWQCETLEHTALLERLTSFLES